MTSLRRKPIYLALLAGLCACSTINKQVNNDIATTEKQTRGKYTEAPAVQIAQRQERVSVVKGSLLPAKAVAGGRAGEWLRKLRLAEIDLPQPTPLSAIVKKFAEQGVNVVTDLPLENFGYAGKVNATDAQTALQIILGSVGLDMQIDDARRVVMIRPMASKTWILNLGNRKATYSTDSITNSSGSNSSSTSTSTTATATASTSNNPLLNMASPNVGTTTTSGTSSASGSGSVGTSTSTIVYAQDDFWASLSAELGRRLSVMVPRSAVMASSRPGGGTGVPGTDSLVTPSPANASFMGVGQAQQPQGNDLYVSKQIGQYAVNPDTGAITVQAPSWILKDLDRYISNIEDMYNSELSFIGEVVLVNSSRIDSEGIDLAAIGRWASGRYGAVLSNNALGGVTISVPSSGFPQVAAGSQSVGGALGGLTYVGPNNALEVFNAYLSEIGQFSVVQSPRISTSSGIPAVFSEKNLDYYNTVTQQTAAGNTGAATTANNNTITPIETGIELRLNPRFDPVTGLIRTQLELYLALQSGSKTVPQTLVTGNTVTTVPTTIPLTTKKRIAGEVLMRDGDVIIVGGQTADTMQVDENGLPGENSPTGGVFGVKKATRGRKSYYFALRAVVTKRTVPSS